MSYLCIDLGNKRCGIATSKENIAFAHVVVPRTELIGFIKKYLWENTPEKIVVGLPYDLYGKDTSRLEKTEEFIKKLCDIFPEIDIIGHDERFSSFEARQGWYDDHRDDIAAACILQSYIDSIDNKN